MHSGIQFLSSGRAAGLLGGLALLFCVSAASSARAGSISGTVRDSSGNPLANVMVQAHLLPWSSVGSAWTAASGDYSITGLPAGSYLVMYSRYDFLTEWYAGKADFSSADAVAVAAEGSTAGIDAILYKGGSITGMVRDSSGNPFPSVEVEVQDLAANYVRNALTDALGAYSITGLRAGTYKVRFFRYEFLTEWYGDKADFASADPVPVTAEATTSGIDATLMRGGTITGTVTGVGGAPLAGLEVYLFTSDEGWSPWTRTDASGLYTFSGLSPGSYKVRCAAEDMSDYLDEWYADKADLAAADAVAVGEETTSVIDMSLTLGGAVTGSVTNAVGMQLEGVRVWVYDSAGRNRGGAVTDFDGGYALRGLRTGDYTLGFFPGDYSGYLSEWYSDQTDQAAGDTVSVTAGEAAAVIDAVLALGGSITGTVTDSAGSPIAGVRVSVHQLSGGWLREALTDSSGVYSLGGLPTGSYKVSYEDWTAGSFNGWYPHVRDLADAVAIAVRAEEATSGIDVVLMRAGSISGRVVDSLGSPIKWVGVGAYRLDGIGGGTRETSTDGFFTISGLYPGDYRLKFGSDGGDYFVEWYADKAQFGVADVVTVAEGETTSGIVAVLSQVGSLSGTVTDTRGSAIAGARVVACELNGSWAKHTLTDAGGSYFISGLTAGAYKVLFEAEESGYLGEWFTDKETIGEADPVLVVPEETTGGIDAVLLLGGSISGTVRDIEGLSAVDVGVVVHSLDGAPVAYTHTATTGSYSVGGLPAGYYKVEFLGSSPGSESQWYANKADFSAAEVVTVVAETTTPGIDAVLNLAGPALFGSISGTVTGAGGIPVLDMGVRCIHAIGGWAVWGWTDSTGAYTIGGLPAGAYTVLFDAEGTRYLSEWYADKATMEAATPVNVVAAQATRGIDAVLTLGGSITGVARDGAGGPIAGLWVEAADLDGDWIGSRAQTDVTGAYTLGGLATGDYKVFFSADWLGYFDEWYADAADSAAATAVHVTAAEVVSGIDAVMTSGGSIAGVVSGAGGGPIERVRVIARDLDENWRGSAWTDPSGSYTIIGLATGSYKVYFESFPWLGHLPEWYSDKADFATATTVAVNVEETTSGIDAVLALGGSISGAVTDPAGNPIPWLHVEAFAPDGEMMGDGQTDASGSYSIGGLPTGSYKVEFQGGWRGFIDEWYDDTEGFGAATAVPVTAGETVAGIDAMLARGGIIAGRVTGVSGRPIPRVQVSAFDSVGSRVGDAETDPLGDYAIGGLPTGSYRLEFKREGLGYITEWYADAGDFATANAVAVTADSTTSGIDAILVLGGWAPVLGVIGDWTVMEGSLLAFRVLARDPDGGFLTYGASGLPDGAVFDPGTGEFSWVPGYSQEGSYVVDFVVSDGALTDAGRITITVTNPAGRLFFDDFTDGASPAEWLRISGAWSAKGRVFSSTSLRKINFARILQVDPASFPLGPGEIQVKMKLTSSASRAGPNGMIVFGFQDPAHYRWVKVTPSQILIGQTGAFEGVRSGTKKKVSKSQPLGKFGLYTVKVFPDGWVRVYKGTSGKPALSHRFVVGGAPTVVPGGVGLAASKARTIFDNVTVWDASGL